MCPPVYETHTIDVFSIAITEWAFYIVYTHKRTRMRSWTETYTYIRIYLSIRECERQSAEFARRPCWGSFSKFWSKLKLCIYTWKVGDIYIYNMLILVWRYCQELFVQDFGRCRLFFCYQWRFNVASHEGLCLYNMRDMGMSKYWMFKKIFFFSILLTSGFNAVLFFFFCLMEFVENYTNTSVKFTQNNIFQQLYIKVHIMYENGITIW